MSAPAPLPAIPTAPYRLVRMLPLTDAPMECTTCGAKTMEREVWRVIDPREMTEIWFMCPSCKSCTMRYLTPPRGT